MHYYIIAGERSGDLHASNLVKQLKKMDRYASFRGFGGDHMKAEGVDIIVPYSAMSFMGFIEVLFNIFTITKYLSLCKEDIIKAKPDVVILVDYGGFNLKIAKFCKKQGIKVFYYIPPKVWAWYQSRAIKLKESTDRIFVILPFEKTFFNKFHCDADYVGNPVCDAVKAHVADVAFASRHQIDKERPLIALLPGSRKQELKRIIPLLVEVVRSKPELMFAVAAVNNLEEELYSRLRVLPNVKFIYEDTYNLLLNSTAAIVTSGTATLETALFKVPQVVVYKANSISYWLGKLVIKVKYISLVNLIAGNEVVKELLQHEATPIRIIDQLDQILTQQTQKNDILKGYEMVIKLLDTGTASVNTAKLMYEYLNPVNQTNIN